MNVLLVLFCSAFKTLKINIDATSLNYSGSTEDYSWNDPKSFNTITFRLAEGEDEVKVEAYIRENYALDEQHAPMHKFFMVRREFESYEKDKRTKFIINFKSGSKGMVNPPSFDLRPITVETED